MAENSRLSDETKNNSTDTSSTDASSAVIGNHENAVVPHKISNHEKLVQTMVMVDGEWINVNDTNDQANMKDDMNKVNKKVVEAQKGIVEAKSAADSAAKAADSAVSASVVNSDAITAQSAAISEAKSAISSVTAAIQQTAANAASDAAKIRVDVAQVQSEIDANKAANSASVEALKSDVSAAKQDLADVHDSLTKAQAAAEESQKAIDKSIAQINSDIEQGRKDIASAQQANADTAKQLDTYSKQAQDQGKTIKSIQDKQDGFTATLADVQGNVTQVSDKVDGLSAGLKDAQDNVASIKAQADQLSATLTDHAKSIATLTASAKELSSTLEDADGRLSKVEQTAQTNSSTLSDVQGDLSQVKQDTTTLTATLKDAQGNISTLQQKADSVSAQLASAQGDIASLQTDVTGIKATLVSHEGDIHTLQADSKSLHDSMQDAQGDISTLKKTSTDVTSELKDHAGRISKTEQTAATLTNEFADQQGHLTRVEQKATGTEQTVANQQGQINNIKTDVSGVHETIMGQGNQIANINVTLNGLSSKYEGVSGDLGKLKDQTNWKIVTGVLDANQYTKTARIFYQGTQAKNTPNTGWFYLIVDAPSTSRITQTLIRDNTTDTWTRVYNGSWQAWTKGATNLDITALSNRITTNSTQITQNKQAIALKADQSTVSNLSGEVSQAQAQLKVQAGQISSKVSSEDFNTLSNKVNGMKIGGRNLLHGTSDKPKSLQGSGWLAQSTASDIYTSTANYHGGNQFTYSALITNNSSKPVTLETWLFKGQEKGHDPINVNSHSQVVPPHAQNQRASTTFAITAETHWIRTYVIYSTGDGIPSEMVNVSEEQLEEGNVRTPWTPNPDDTIASIKKNSTAIDENSKAIKLKADATEVNNLKGTVNSHSASINLFSDQLKSMVTESKVNDIINGKGFATQSYTQSIVNQKADQWNTTIAGLTQQLNNSSDVNLAEKTNQGTTNWIVYPGNGASTISEVNINGIRGVRFTQTRKSTSWWVIAYQLNLNYFEPNQDYIISFDIRTSSDNFSQGGMLNIARGDSSHAYLANTSFRTNFKKNQLTHVSCTGHSYGSLDKSGETFYLNSLGLGQCDWVDVVNLKIARGTIDKGYSPAPSDTATTTQLTTMQASIDGLQGIVKNKVDQSQYTQLAGVVQTKVSQSDFNRLNNQVNVQTLDSANIDNMKTTGHYFVRNLTGNPIGGWVYVDVTGNANDRIRQDVYQDSGTKHAFRRWFGSYWTGWSTGAEESEITQLRSDINLRVKSGDLLSQINIAAGHTLIQSNKIYFDADSFVMSPNSKAFIPSAYITNINADKITTGTLDAAKFNVRNFSANNITGGTLSGVVVKTGANDRYFQTSKDNIYWVRNGSMSLIGNDTYLNSANGLNIADENNIQLTTWGGATVNKDGSITNLSGNSGHPKIIIDPKGKYNPDDIYGSAFGGGPGNSEIAQWVGNKEYTVLTRGKGFTVHLNDGNNNSKFSIQKDNKVGFYVGGGNDGNEIQIAGFGPIKLQGRYIDDGFDDGMTHTFGNVQVDNLHVRKWLGVDQSKNAIVKTSQGPVTINAYETAEYYFGDIGEGQTSTDGIAYIGIEKLFNETVNTTIPYHVFITAYGPGNIWVDQREHNRFIVKSDQPNLKFSWEIKAKRKGYEHTRLQNVDDKLNHMAVTS